MRRMNHKTFSYCKKKRKITPSCTYYEVDKDSKLVSIRYGWT